MVDWQITATTVVCRYIDEEVTISVFSDWTVKCTGQEKYLNKSAKSKGTTSCNGLDCPDIVEYKLKLQNEEETQAKDKVSRE